MVVFAFLATWPLTGGHIDGDVLHFWLRGLSLVVMLMVMFCISGYVASH